MSGGPKQTTDTKNKETMNQSTNMTGTSQLTPYEPAQGILNSFLGDLQAYNPNTEMTGAENSAYDQLRAASQYGVPEQQGVAQGLLSGFNQYKDTLSPIANGDFINQNNPQTQQLISQISNAAQNNTHDLWSRAGRSFSPGEAGAISKNTTEGLAPTLFNQYNLERQNQVNAANNIWSGQQGYASQAPGMYQNIAQQMMQPGALTLQQQEAMRALPYQGLSQMSSLLLPIASAFGTNNTSQQGTVQGLTKSKGNSVTQQESDPFQTALGGGLGLLGLGLSGGGTAGFGGSLLGSLFK